MSAVSTNEAAVIAHFSRGPADSTASPNRYACHGTTEPLLHRNLGTACTSLAWCCRSVDLAVIDLSTILEIGHNILIYSNYRDALTQQSD